MRYYTTFILSLAIMLLSISVYSQQYEIKGKVVGNSSNKPVEFVNAILMKNDSIYSNAVTDSIGSFSFDVKKGNYILLLTQFDEELYRQKVFINNNIDLKVIEVDNAIELEEITIQGIKKITKETVDKTTLNVKGEKLFEGDNAVSILSKIQGVLIVDGRILYDGVDITSVKVDNRTINFSSQKEIIDFLKGLGNNSIENIEIFNKSAKSSANSTGKVLNINTDKRTLDGFNLTPKLEYSKGVVSSTNLSVFSQAKKGKLSSNVFLNYGLQKGYIGREYSTYYKDIDEHQNQKDEVFNNIKPLYIDLGVQYDFNPKTFLGIAATYDNMTLEDNTTSDIFVQKSDTKLHSLNISKFKHDSYTVSLYLNHKIDSLQNLRIEVNYNNYSLGNNQLLNTGKDASTKSQKIERKTITPNISLDYKRKIFTDIDFSAGVLYYMMDNSENRISNQVAPIIFDFKEKVFAQYVSLTGDNKYFSYQIGLRGEKTDNLFQSYYNLFPSISLRKKIFYNASLQISYNKSILRPMGYMLSPNQRYINPYLAEVGNPKMLPQVKDEISMVFSYGNWRLSSLYSLYNNNIGKIPTISNSNKKLVVNKYTNISSKRAFEANLSYSFYNNYMSITPMLYFTLSDFKLIEEETERIRNYLALFNITSSFNINETNRIDANFKYQFANKEMFTENKANSSFGISYNKKFKNNLNLSIFIKDLFKGELSRSTRMFGTTQIKSTEYRDSRQIGIALRYTFDSGEGIEIDGVKNNVNRK